MKKLRVKGKWFMSLGLIFSLMMWGAPAAPAEEAKTDKAAELQKVEATAEAATEPEKPQWNVQTDILSQYVWRGIALSRNSMVIQPSFTGTYKGFAVNVWNNFDMREENPFSLTRPDNKKAHWNETDLTFSYTREVIKNLSLTGGTIIYLLDGANSAFNSIEIYGGADYKLPWFNFGAGVYREVNHFPGTFLQWYIHRAIDIPWIEGMNLDLWASWSAEFSNDKAAFPVYDSAGNLENSFYRSLNAGHLMVTLNIPLGKYVVVAPKVMYWYALGGQSTATLSGLSWDGKHNHILGGVNLAVNF